MKRSLPWIVVIVLAFVLGSGEAAAQEGPGLAAQYPNDVGLASDPAVLYFLDFNDEAETMTWSRDKTGYGWTSNADNVLSGGGALEIQQTTGTHDPFEIQPTISETDVAYVRWYRKWEAGYDFTQHKMPGVYAKAPGATGAGEIPTGYDKYSLKLFVDFERRPRFYSYHPDQTGPWGDSPQMNLVDPPIQVVADRWYCFEMMIRANTVGVRDGELKMWIDGQLVGHIENMRFRETADLKINQFTYSAYVGGNWTSERDQKLWDDQIVVAREYIGPLVTDNGGTAGADGGAPGTNADGGAPGTNADAGTSGGNGDDLGGSGGCGCGVGSEDSPLQSAVLWLALAALWLASRRRSRGPRR